MEKPDGTLETQPEAKWGTWEELLLACAVNRYGTDSWDSVAVEVQKRSSTSSTLNRLLTPSNCKRKYHDLKRRYTTPTDPNGDDFEDGDDKRTQTIPWLDELRKLRVAELKLELERYDLSIVYFSDPPSLQSKVKRLTEEREQSLRESGNEEERSDLKSVETESAEDEKSQSDNEPEKLSPGSGARKPSVDESNSTDPKEEDLKTVIERAEKGNEPDSGPGRTGSLKPVREDSCNGSSESVDKNPVLESVKVEPVSDSAELCESVAESEDGEEEGAKETSDVQSSASKSMKEGNDKLLCGSSSAGERENEGKSLAVEGTSVESPALVDFLERLRNHKLGSVFYSRLESQETPHYGNLIKQHMDLETVQTRLEEGWYADSKNKFYRDLQLLVNNAIVFFSKESSEFVAAVELRQLISKEKIQSNVELDLPAEKQTSVPLVSLPSKHDAEPSDSFLLKPKLSGPLIVCRKRSSIAAKASASSSEGDPKREQTAALAEEKPVLGWKKPNKSLVNEEEHKITKKRSSDRFASGSKISKGNSKTRTNTNPNKNLEANSDQNQVKGRSSGEHLDPKSEKKNNPTTSDVKKRSAANFLNRMKRGSSSNNGLLLETLKSSPLSAENNTKGGSEQKRNGNGKGDGRKDQVPKRTSGGRQVKQQGSPAKRSVGRPSKRAAAPPPPPPPVLGKRNRERVETEAVTSKQPKKRSRK
ncbi:unnamed protein product [Ilex paraguariensis]|uniref:Bromo domain-containing protein n=1 Tax=Ilex paraguariensis TaxID=185542 RepID=A0ABC8TGU4_9AQUA